MQPAGHLAPHPHLTTPACSALKCRRALAGAVWASRTRRPSSPSTGASSGPAALASPSPVCTLLCKRQEAGSFPPHPSRPLCSQAQPWCLSPVPQVHAPPPALPQTRWLRERPRRGRTRSRLLPAALLTGPRAGTRAALPPSRLALSQRGSCSAPGCIISTDEHHFPHMEREANCRQAATQPGGRALAGAGEPTAARTEADTRASTRGSGSVPSPQPPLLSAGQNPGRVGGGQLRRNILVRSGEPLCPHPLYTEHTMPTPRQS